VIERKIEMVRVCPEELRLDLPESVVLPEGAVLKGNQAGLGYVNSRFRREELLAARLADAKGQCP
jgi:hypothetical protein